MPKPEAWAYIARTTKTTEHHPAGTAVAATVDCPDYAAENARHVAKWMRDGCTIERVPVAWVRQHLFTTTPYVPD